MKFKDWHDVEYELPNEKVPSWRPSAYAIIQQDNKILLIKSKLHGKWELPGGGIELNETIIEGLIREVLEETGYKIVIKNKIPIYMEDNFFYASDLDEYFRAIPLVFVAEIEDDKQEEDIDKQEIDEIKWIKFDDIKNYDLKSMTSQCLKDFKFKK